MLTLTPSCLWVVELYIVAHLQELVDISWIKIGFFFYFAFQGAGKHRFVKTVA